MRNVSCEPGAYIQEINDNARDGAQQKGTVASELQNVVGAEASNNPIEMQRQSS